MCHRVYIGKCHWLKNESHLSEWVNATCLFSLLSFFLSFLSLCDWPLIPMCLFLFLSQLCVFGVCVYVVQRSSRHIQLQVILWTSWTDWLIWSRQEKSVYSPGPRQEWIHRRGGAQVRMECMCVYVCVWLKDLSRSTWWYRWSVCVCLCMCVTSAVCRNCPSWWASGRGHCMNGAAFPLCMNWLIHELSEWGGQGQLKKA